MTRAENHVCREYVAANMHKTFGILFWVLMVRGAHWGWGSSPVLLPCVLKPPRALQPSPWGLWGAPGPAAAAELLSPGCAHTGRNHKMTLLQSS